MALFALIIGLILIVAAVRNSQGDLFSALETDVPKFVVWAVALLAIGALGYVPGMKIVSRWLLALVLVVLIVNNYQKAITGFQNAWQGAAKQAQPGNTSSGASGSSAASGNASNPFGIILNSAGQIVGAEE